ACLARHADGEAGSILVGEGAAWFEASAVILLALAKPKRLRFGGARRCEGVARASKDGACTSP
ncbi:MAG: hypothetical protein ACAH04_03850, partial [Methylibium sp.]